jgi:hypothetical protein
MFLAFLNGTRIVFAPEDGVGTPPAAAEDTSDTGDTGDTGTGDTGAPKGNDDRPDWLPEKFKTPEDLAKAYDAATAKLFTKTELLKEQVAKEMGEDIVANYAKQIGVPEGPDGYEYPEGWEPPAESVDQSFREWARKHNVSPDAFKELVSDVYGQTMIDFNAEVEKLGPDAQQRIDRLNNWLGKHVDEHFHPVLAQTLTTATGVEFMEMIADQLSGGGFAPTDVGDSDSSLTREGIRALQADPRYGKDETYTAMVRRKWQAYAALPENRRK